MYGIISFNIGNSMSHDKIDYILYVLYYLCVTSYYRGRIFQNQFHTYLILELICCRQVAQNGRLITQF